MINLISLVACKKDSGNENQINHLDEVIKKKQLLRWNKEREYAIWFTGTKINHARIEVTFESESVEEKERPSR